MSVILYEDEKFHKIYSTLYTYSYRENFVIYPFKLYNHTTEQAEEILKSFVKSLCHSNIEAFNERYKEDEPFRKLELKRVMPYASKLELLKSLKSLDYNSVEAVNFDGTRKFLHDLIYSLMSDIINSMPAYEKAMTW